MHKLPDGSGFFVGTVGPREPGILNFLKYRKQGCARRYLFVWRMYRDYRRFYPAEPRWKAVKAALVAG
jgi:hypothetical protein